MLVHIQELIRDATKQGYALGAFNIHNLETALGVARAAVAAHSPAIIQVSEGTIKYCGLKPITHIVSTIAKNEAAAVPIALHLDHGKSFSSVVECIHAGFSSVHMDGSSLPLDENIAITKQAVDFAHPKNVWVQGEVGAILGGHGETGSFRAKIPLADPREVAEFIAATGVDTLAAAVGTAHGDFDNEKIDFDLIKNIKKLIGDRPLVLHGGTGVKDKDIAKAISLGVNIINIGTEVKECFTQAVIKQAMKKPEETDPRYLLTPGIEAVQQAVAAKMELFGSANRV